MIVLSISSRTPASPCFWSAVSDQARRLSERERKPVRMEPGVAARRSARVG